MIRLAHIVQIFDAPRASEWDRAQPLTFASMRAAKEFARDRIAVDLYAVRCTNENVSIPDGFSEVRPLDRDVNAVGRFRASRPLPLLRDILDRLYEESSAEYFLYTNVDIVLMPHCYDAIRHFIQHGHDAIVINRRTIPTTPDTPDDLPVMYSCVGTVHPGFDCFVFRREYYPRFVLGDVCLGTGHVDLPLICSMIATCHSFLPLPDRHLTFHLGDRRVWKSFALRDERAHNDREASRALRILATSSPRPMHWPYRLMLRFRMVKNSFFVREFRRMFSR